MSRRSAGRCRSRVIVYSRNNGVLAPDTALRLADACPNLDRASRTAPATSRRWSACKRRAGDRLALINGVPTAEIIARAMLRRRRDAATPRRSSPSCRALALALSTGALRDGDARDGRPAARRVLRAARPRSAAAGAAMRCRSSRPGCGVVGRRPGRCGRRSSTSTAAESATLAALIAARRRCSTASAGAPARRQPRRWPSRCGSRSGDIARAAGDRLRPHLDAGRRASSSSRTAAETPVDGRRADRLALRGEGRGAGRASGCCRCRAPAPTRSTSPRSTRRGLGLQRLRARGADRRIRLRRDARPRRRLRRDDPADRREAAGRGAYFSRAAARRARRQDARPRRPRPYRRGGGAARQGLRHAGDGGDRRRRATARRRRRLDRHRPTGSASCSRRPTIVVLACPLNEATRGMIGAARAAADEADGAPRSTSRAPRSSTRQDLFEALRSGAIGGAVLDPWYRYPASPADDADAVALSVRQPAECADDAAFGGLDRRRLGAALRRLRAATSPGCAAGEPLLNVVRAPLPATPQDM